MKRKDIPEDSVERSAEPLVKKFRPDENSGRDDKGYNLFVGKSSVPHNLDEANQADLVSKGTVEEIEKKKISATDLFYKMTVRDVLEDISRPLPKVVVLNSSDTVRTALTTFKENDISAAPIWDEQLRGYNIIDILDLATNFFEKEDKVEFFDRRILPLCNQSSVNPLQPFTHVSSVDSLLKTLSFTTHHIVIVDDSMNGKDKIKDVLTQTDILRFFIRHLLSFADILRGTKAEDIMNTNALFINDAELLSVALKHLTEHKYPGAGVTETTESGSKLIGNISLADLRSIRLDAFYSCLYNMTVKEFLETMGKDHHTTQPRVIGEPHIVKPPTPVICFKDASLESIMRKMLAEHVHRIYVIDQFSHPLGLVTITDIIDMLYEKLSKTVELQAAQ